MSASRLPGPICQTLNYFKIDTGTLCLWESPLPGSVISKYPNKQQRSIHITGKRLPPKAERILIEILRSCGLYEACVTNTVRTIREQVGVMVAYYKRHGATAAKKTYGEGPGGRALGIYEARIGQDNQDEIFGIMATVIEAAINAERSSGGQRHLMHTSDTHYVFDIDPVSIFNKTAFVHAASIHPEVTRFLHPSSTPPDQAYHIEILR